MTVPLAPRLDTAAAAPLQQMLTDRIGRGEAVVLDGSAVERTGLACLQVLAAARTAAVAHGLAFRVEQPGEPLAEMARLAGFDAILDPA